MSVHTSPHHTIRRFTDAPDVLGEHPGEMRPLTEALGAEQVAVTHRRMPPGSGGKGGYGHRHRTQEEIVLVTAGALDVKLDDEVLRVEAGAAVRIAPDVVRSLWNPGPEDAELLIVSRTVPDPDADAELVEGFWPADEARADDAEDREGQARAGALAERLFGAMVDAMDLACVHLGLRLGLYAALAERGASRPAELAAATGTDERYVREWLEQQAVTGILVAHEGPHRAFSLPAGHDVVLLDEQNLAYMAPTAGFVVGGLRPIEALVDAFRTGAGVPFADYGRHIREAIAGFNRPLFAHQLAAEWLPALPDVDRRLRGHGGRIADFGCGIGWSSINLARAYPLVTVDGFDSDEASIDEARRNAERAGLAGRVRFHARDAGSSGADVRYDLVTIFEALHDMAHPARALAEARRLVEPGGSVLIGDSRAAETFTAPGDDLERLLYGASVLHCLAVSRCEHGSAMTGTAIRPHTVDAYAREAGFSGAAVLPIEHDFWRFYRLDA